MNNTKQRGLSHQLGFTLIEIMLVVLLIGLASTIVVMTVDDSGQKKIVKRTGHKMAALADIALDKAVLSGRDFGMVFTRNTYHFVELIEQRWQPVQDDVLKEQKLENIAMLAEIDGFKWLPDQTDYSSSALFSERDIDEELDEKEKPHIPQLLILSSGEMTPFTIMLTLDNVKITDLRQDELDYVVTVQANALGIFHVKDSNDLEP